MRRLLLVALLGTTSACSSSDGAPVTTDDAADDAREAASEVADDTRPDEGSDDADVGSDDDAEAGDAPEAFSDAPADGDGGDPDAPGDAYDFDATIDSSFDSTVDSTVDADAGDGTVVSPFDDSKSTLWFQGGFANAHMTIGRHDLSTGVTTKLRARVESFDLSAAGDVFAFTSQVFLLGRADVWLMNGDGSGAHPLVTMPGQGDATAVKVSPDGRMVAYLADPDSTGLRDVFLVSTAGGAPRKVSPLRGAAADPKALQPDSMQWSADSHWLAIVGAFSSSGVHQIWAVDAKAATPTPRTLTAATDVGVAVAPATWVGADPALPVGFASGGRVLFRGQMQIDAKPFLYAVGLDGYGLAKVPGPVTSANLRTFGVSADGAQVAFASDSMLTNAYEIYVMPSSGGSAPERVSSGFVAAGQGPLTGAPLTYSPDGSAIAFIANIGTGSRREPFVVASKPGGQTRRLAQDARSGVTSLAWSPEGKQLAVLADFDTTSGQQELYRLDVTQADQTPTKVVPATALTELHWTPPPTTQPFDPDAGVDAGYADALASDGAIAGSSRLWFTSDWLYPGNSMLERLDLPGTAAVGLLADSIDVRALAVSADGARVAVVAEIGAPLDYGVWVIDAAGTSATKVASAGDYLSGLQFSPDGAWLAFERDAAVWVVPSAGGVAEKQVSPAAVGISTTDVRFSFSPDSKTLAMIVGAGGSYKHQLYFCDVSAIPAAPYAPISIAGWSAGVLSSYGPEATMDSGSPAWLGPDEVLVVGNHGSVGAGFLRISKTSTAPVLVAGSPSSASRFRVSPDRKSVAYPDASSGAFSLLSLAGGTPVRLASSSYKYISNFAWRPDGSAIAFLASVNSFFGGTTHAAYLAPYSTTDYPTLLALASLVSDGSYTAPVWAPDGSTFALSGASSSLSTSKREVLRLDNVTTPNQTWRVLHTTTNASLYVAGLAWTP